jgi:hypothetical protein
VKPDWDNAYPEYYLFSEEEVVMKNVQISNASCLVFDIKRYNFVTQQSMDFGFAVYPLAS